MMRFFAFWCLAVTAWAGIPLDEYQARRKRLITEVGNKAVLLAGATEADHGEIRAGFLQEPNFLYLTGWREPGATILLAPDEEILFLPKRSTIRERYTGPKLGPDDQKAPQQTGFAKVMDETEIRAQLKRFTGKIHTITRGEPFARLQRAVGDREWVDISREIARLRMVKSPAEVDLIRKSVEHTIAGHRAAWTRIGAGMYEYQAANIITSTYFDAGCERNAYLPIVGSGPNSVILHYGANRRRMDAGEVVVMDVGAECSDYAADITRTVPVTGKFTARQREIYEAVLEAQNAAIAAAKPGMKLLGTDQDSLNGIAKAQVAKHGLEQYYLHALGHHVGLEVHDPADPDLTLKPGMVFTVEPGIYIADEKIGVRIEDVILITETGAEVLSSSLPRDPKDVETALRKK
ncbi:MAG: aminopeptidase P family protein [Bryobacterales bacterium]|nr:aminopeptidase P family protein [Bryobacterales bacterium]